MSYFSHAFMKAFPATLRSQVGPTVADVNDGFLIQAGVHTKDLRNGAAPIALGTGVFGFFNKDNYLSVVAGSPEVLAAKALILAGAAIQQNDKIGQFHGGYAESNKSKYINPKFINRFYKMNSAAPEQSIVHIGVTNFQPGTTLNNGTLVPGAGYPTDGTFTNVATTVAPAGGTGMTVDIVVIGGVVTSIVENQVGSGYAIADVITVADDAVTGVPVTPATIAVLTIGDQTCEFEFLCGETYNLLLNLNGSPVLRVLNRDSYRTLAAYTGCCPEGTISPVAVDSTLVMIDWAKQIIESPYLKDFVRPVVYTEAGKPLFATGEEAVAAGYLVTDVWESYVSTGHTEGALAGIRLMGAYVDTVFGDCTFQCSDFFQKEIVQIQASLVDETGDPCAFDGICIETECCGFGGEGFGETYLREILLCESYLQNSFSSDLRIREITNGQDYFGAGMVQRDQFYTKYVIQHTVPRYSNPSGIYDNDQYALCLYMPSTATNVDFELFMKAWLGAANNPVELEEFRHVPCVPEAL